jgi:hypothetical protein
MNCRQRTDRRHHRSQARQGHDVKDYLLGLYRSFGFNWRKYRLSSKC